MNSRKQYVEMDDLLIPQVPSTVTDVESQQTPDYRGMDRFADLSNVDKPKIVKTVSINQSLADRL